MLRRRKDSGRALPFGDLGGMDTKLPGQFVQRFVTFDRGQSHLGLESGPVIACRSLHRRAPLVCHQLWLW